MTPQFFSVEDNSFDTSGAPWIQSILRGLVRGAQCPRCGKHTRANVGELDVVLLDERGECWPDVIGCGGEPLLIVSARVLQDWKDDGVGEFPYSAIHILDPLPERLAGTEPPEYFWIDGRKLIGAKLDFQASGFVGVQFCSACGNRHEDVSATYDRQHSAQWSYTFLEGTWTGEHLFTTDLSPYAFFCTDAVVECARRHRHTNFRFIPVEEGDNPKSRGLRYLD